MQPTSLAKAIEFARRKYPGESRDELVRRINMVRQVMWKSPEKRELVFKEQGQEQVDIFRDFSQYGCRRLFTGITLPVNITVAKYLEVNGRHIPIESGVLHNMPAGMTGDRHRPVAMRMQVKAQLKRDVPRNNRAPIVFRCVDADDNGKRVGVEYQVASGGIVREDILISASGPETTQIPVQFLSITFPQRKGWIQVTTAEGYDLGSYAPSILSPQHIRFHINGVCGNQFVKWVGLQEPMDVVFDSDEVEMSSQLDWESAFMWCELHLKATKTPEEQRTYQQLAAFDAAAMASDLSAEQGSPALTLRPRESALTWRRLRGLNSRGYGGRAHGW